LIILARMISRPQVDSNDRQACTYPQMLSPQSFLWRMRRPFGQISVIALL
jgi:hypothetical protein